MLAFRIIFLFATAAASAVAQSEDTAAAALIPDTASIILAQRPVSLIQIRPLAEKMIDRAVSSAVGSDTLPGKPGYNPSSTSKYILSEIAAGLPRFNSSPKATNVMAQGTIADGRAFLATPGAELMPAFIVRDSKVPNAEQILTYEGRAKIAMDKYLGPSDGLDRGMLNRFTLKQLWMKIPILLAFSIEFVGTPVRMSNEERAFDAAGANDTIPYPHPPPGVKDGSNE